MKSKTMLLAAALLVAGVVPTTTKADEGLPEEAPRSGTVITIDVATNTAYLFQDGSMVTKSRAATGTEKLLKKGLRIWL